ncbi:MAG: hypothetical protein NTW14_11325 [bacterium]|nr:hypothetical protein [bacterium]
MFTKWSIRTLILGIWISLSVQDVVASKPPTVAFASFKKNLATYFNEVKVATAQHKDLWNYDLYAPILLIQPDTRELYANMIDSASVLKQDGEIYTGFLPKEDNFANTTIHWNGTQWAMIMLPLPGNLKDRLTLITHELFHRAQPILGFSMVTTDNNHLDSRDGRIYLRLELEALEAAIQAPPTEIKRHLRDALIIRKYRHSLYSGADSTENLLELNEGIAEFTGIMTSGMNHKEIQDHFRSGITAFLRNPTFVKSFAYITTPIYGVILFNQDQQWNKKISNRTNLTDFFIKAFGVDIPADLKAAVDELSEQYNARTINAEENLREETQHKLAAEYRKKLVEQPHLEIQFIHMNISYDPRNIMPLEGLGNVYPTISVTDDWGILKVEGGALLSSQWDKISLSQPLEIGEAIVTGDGWNLELKKGWSVQLDSLGHYYLSKKK